MAIGATQKTQPPVAQWEVPIKGVIRDIRNLKIPPDALYDALNAELIDDTVQGRRGLTAFTAQLFGSTPSGALNFWQNTTASFVALATLAKIWTLELATSTWTDRAGALTATIDDPARIIQFSFGTPLTNRIYQCNGVNPLKTWKPGDATATDVAGSPPIFRDITVVADRIIGLVGSHEIRWSEPLTDATWPLLNAKSLSETADPSTAIRAIGAVGAAAYKRTGIWLGEVTGLSGASAFRWQMVDQKEGPAGPNALVDADGAHIYMTKNGRVGSFTGVSHNWIADGSWAIVKAEIDQTKPNRVHGVYLRDLAQIRFFYKRIGIADTDGCLIVQLPRKVAEVPFSAWPCRMGKSITAGCTMVSDDFTTSLVFSNNAAAEKTYKIEGSTDDGVAISSHIQHGLVIPNALEVGRVLALEAFVERLAGFGTLTAKIAFSNILDAIAGTLTPGATIDLTSVPVKSVTGFDVRGRFLALRLEWTGASTVKYRGAVLRGQEGN